MVEDRLRQNDDYARMIERKKRCIRLTYADEFHLDVLPSRPSLPPVGTQILVPDRELRAWLRSNPKGYAEWFESQSALSLVDMRKRVESLPEHECADEKSSLQRVVQLLKRWRDVRYQDSADAAPRSIVLTTLAGNNFTGTSSTAGAFDDVVGALVRVTNANREPLRVVNPAQREEVLSEQWMRDPRSYELFAFRIAELCERWRAIRQHAAIEEVAEELAVLFGDKVTSSAFRHVTAEHIEPKRSHGTLGVGRVSGALSIAPAAGVAPVRRNTFFGGA
jgi:hypothetical protein